MANLNGFNATEVEPNTGFDAIPAGKYRAIVTNSVMKPTKAGDGEYLEMCFQIVEGKFQNRLLWDRLNLVNPSVKAVEIAKGTLSSICRSVGVLEPKDSAELHNKPLVISVKCKQDNGGDLTNEIKGYSKDGVAAQPAQTQPAQPQEQVGTTGGSAAAWANTQAGF